MCESVLPSLSMLLVYAYSTFHTSTPPPTPPAIHRIALGIVQLLLVKYFTFVVIVLRFFSSLQFSLNLSQLTFDGFGHQYGTLWFVGSRMALQFWWLDSFDVKMGKPIIRLLDINYSNLKVSAISRKGKFYFKFLKKKFSISIGESTCEALWIGWTIFQLFNVPGKKFQGISSPWDECKIKPNQKEMLRRAYVCKY